MRLAFFLCRIRVQHTSVLASIRVHDVPFFDGFPSTACEFYIFDTVWKVGWGSCISSFSYIAAYIQYIYMQLYVYQFTMHRSRIPYDFMIIPYTDHGNRIASTRIHKGTYACFLQDKHWQRDTHICIYIYLYIYTYTYKYIHLQMHYMYLHLSTVWSSSWLGPFQRLQVLKKPKYRGLFHRAFIGAPEVF